MVAIQTIFEWCLQGTKNEDMNTMTMNIVVEEGLISEQIKKFWVLATSSLFDLTENSDSFKNEVRKIFEYEIEYQNERYIIKLLWNLDKELLNDNRKIAEGMFLRFKKKICRNPELSSEYGNVLQNYLNEGIIEPSNENSDCVSFYLPHREVMGSYNK